MHGLHRLLSLAADEGGVGVVGHVGGVGLAGGYVVPADLLGAPLWVGPGRHTDLAEVGDGLQQLDAVVQRLTAAVVGVAEAGGQGQDVVQLEFLEHGGGDAGEGLGHTAVPGGLQAVLRQPRHGGGGAVEVPDMGIHVEVGLDEVQLGGGTGHHLLHDGMKILGAVVHILEDGLHAAQAGQHVPEGRVDIIHTRQADGHGVPKEVGEVGHVGFIVLGVGLQHGRVDLLQAGLVGHDVGVADALAVGAGLVGL